MHAKPARPRCDEGLHRPRQAGWIEREMRHSICRDCGCTLIRTAATRRWFMSGMLAAGGSARAGGHPAA